MKLIMSQFSLVASVARLELAKSGEKRGKEGKRERRKKARLDLFR